MRPITTSSALRNNPSTPRQKNACTQTRWNCVHAPTKRAISKRRTRLKVNDIQIIPATPEHQPIIANLFELYVHDFSEFHHLDLNGNGRFGYEHLSLDCRKQGRYPFLVLVRGNLAGFAFVKKRSELCEGQSAWEIAEFFVVRAHRKQGIGTHVAHDLFRKFPGRWEIRVMPLNRVALRFWESAITKFMNAKLEPARIEIDDVDWYVYAFGNEQNLNPPASLASFDSQTLANPINPTFLW